MKNRKSKTDYMNSRFANYIEEFGLSFKKTSLIGHAGDRGNARENPIKSFLSEHLPRRYGVTTGEVIDLTGAIGPQLDIMIYNRVENFAFETSGHTSLPAEALLASVEIKSRLSIDEVRKSIVAARRSRSLKPFGRSLGGQDIGAQAGPNAPCRYFHCLFGYATDLVLDNWAKHEFERFVKEGGSDHTIDAIYVLDRGFLNLASNRGQSETPSGHAIANFYFSIFNFLQREGGRRKPAPYDKYAAGHSEAWFKLV